MLTLLVLAPYAKLSLALLLRLPLVRFFVIPECQTFSCVKFYKNQKNLAEKIKPKARRFPIWWEGVA